jgi:hypothetical protein
MRTAVKRMKVHTSTHGPFPAGCSRDARRRTDDSMVDCVYIAASTCDARFTRICVASVRYFYPHVPIKLLAGGPLQAGLVKELRNNWNVEVTDLPRGDYGWGFVKLEPLFTSPGTRFLVLDSDTIVTGPILDLWPKGKGLFLVDDEKQPEEEMRQLYYDWDKIHLVHPDTRPPQFLFNSGQWFGTSGVLTRDDFAPLLEWSMPRKLTYPMIFKNGEQGILNYVLNRKVALVGLCVERLRILQWPGRGLGGIDVVSLHAREAAPLVIHWAGMRNVRLNQMVGHDLLTFFEDFYYSRLSYSRIRRVMAAIQDVLANARRAIRIRLQLACRKHIVPRWKNVQQRFD